MLDGYDPINSCMKCYNEYNKEVNKKAKKKRPCLEDDNICREYRGTVERPVPPKLCFEYSDLWDLWSFITALSLPDGMSGLPTMSMLNEGMELKGITDREQKAETAMKLVNLHNRICVVINKNRN